jgi:zinc transport system substrate-binding protein
MLGLMMRRAWVGLGLIAVMLNVGCRREPPPAPAGGRMKAVATIYPVYDWLREVGGEAVEAAVLVGPGQSPHTFEPTPSTARQAAEARVVVGVGLGLDDWVVELAAGAQQVVRLGETPGLDLIEDDEGVNPHVWLDPQRAAVMVGALGDALAGLDPEHAAAYRRNAKRYQEQLGALSREIVATTTPYRGRSVMTYHNAYAYLLGRCGIEVAGVIEPFPGKEPSAAHLQALVTRARRLGQRVVLADAQLSPKAAEVIAQEIGGRVAILDPLGDPGDAARAHYPDLIRYNVDEIVRALAQAEAGRARR